MLSMQKNIGNNKQQIRGTNNLPRCENFRTKKNKRKEGRRENKITQCWSE